MTAMGIYIHECNNKILITQEGVSLMSDLVCHNSDQSIHHKRQDWWVISYVILQYSDWSVCTLSHTLNWAFEFTEVYQKLTIILWHGSEILVIWLVNIDIFIFIFWDFSNKYSSNLDIDWMYRMPGISLITVKPLHPFTETWSLLYISLKKIMLVIMNTHVSSVLWVLCSCYSCVGYRY